MGEIANYKTGECILCGRTYKGKGGLHRHFQKSKRHWALRKQLPDPELSILINQLTLDGFLKSEKNSDRLLLV